MLNHRSPDWLVKIILEQDAAKPKCPKCYHKLALHKPISAANAARILPGYPIPDYECDFYAGMGENCGCDYIPPKEFQ